MKWTRFLVPAATAAFQPIRRDLPLDEVTAWVERKGDGLVTCEANANGKSWRAQRYLGEIKLTRAEEQGGRVTITTDRLPPRSPDDGVFLGKGRTLQRLELNCFGAEWTDKRIVACVPPSLVKGEYGLRVQASGVLSLFEGTLKVRP